MDVLVGVERRDHDDGDRVLDTGAGEQPGGLDAVQLRHADVEQADVRAQLTAEGDGLASVGGLGDHLDGGLGGEDRGQAGPDDALVVRDQHADRHGALLARGRTAWTHHPPSGSGPACTVPPSRPTRSVMPISPYPGGSAVVPRVPSSRTVSCTSMGLPSTVTTTRVARWAWRRALVIDSWATR